MLYPVASCPEPDPSVRLVPALPHLLGALQATCTALLLTLDGPELSAIVMRADPSIRMQTLDTATTMKPPTCTATSEHDSQVVAAVSDPLLCTPPSSNTTTVSQSSPESPSASQTASQDGTSIPLLTPKARALMQYLLSHAPSSWDHCCIRARSHWARLGYSRGQADIITASQMNQRDEKLPPEWAGIVFCQMRLSARSLCRVLLDVLGADSNLPPPSTSRNEGHSSVSGTVDSMSNTSLRPLFITGKSKQNAQTNSLLDFRSGQFNLLFATDVVEEGLDVRVCQLVINFDLPTTVKSFIQRRGRARALNSLMVAMVPESALGEKMLTDFQRYSEQESEMDALGKRRDVDAEVEDEGGEDEGEGELTEAYQDIEEGEVPEYKEKEDGIGRGVGSGKGSGKAIVLRKNTIQYPEYAIRSTGAVVDVRSASSMLTRYCQQLPHDSYYTPQPIFWDTPGYRCAVLLPSTVPAPIRCVYGPVASSKGLARALAALECIRKLHVAGELNDHFQSIRYVAEVEVEDHAQSPPDDLLALDERKLRNIRVLEKKLEAFRSTSPGSDDVTDTESGGRPGDVSGDGTGDLKAVAEAGALAELSNYDMDLEEQFDFDDKQNSVDILVQSIPDEITFPRETETMVVEEGSPPRTLLYYYGVTVVPCDLMERQRSSLYGCSSCNTHLSCVRRVAFAVSRRVSEEVLAVDIDMKIHTLFNCSGKLRYLGQRDTSEKEVALMQRFHRAVISWEADLSGAEPPPYFDPHEWVKSGGGAYYIVLPLPANFSFDYCRNHGEGNRLFSVPLDWEAFLESSSREAQTLLRGLIKHHSMQNMTESEKLAYDWRTKDAKLTVADLEGHVIRRGPRELFMALPGSTTKLMDVMAYSKEVDGECVRMNEKAYGKLESGEEKDAYSPMTFKDYFAMKAGESGGGDEFADLLDRCGCDLELVKVRGLVGCLSFVPLLGRTHHRVIFEGRPRKDYQMRQVLTGVNHHHAISYFHPAHCEVLGKVEWYFVGLFAPSVLWRLQSLLLAAEVRYDIVTRILQYKEGDMAAIEGSNNRNDISIDPLSSPLSNRIQIIAADCAESVTGHVPVAEGPGLELVSTSDAQEIAAHVPGAVIDEPEQVFEVADIRVGTKTLPMSPGSIPLPLLLEAISPRMALEHFDSERLEMLGDSFLKLVSSIEVFNLYPTKHEGHLTATRAAVINNVFLRKQALAKDIQRYLRAVPLAIGKTLLRKRPPGCFTANDITDTSEYSVWNMNVNLSVRNKLPTETDEVDGSEDDMVDSLRCIHQIIREQAKLHAEYTSRFASSVAAALGTRACQYDTVRVQKKILADLVEALAGAFYWHGHCTGGFTEGVRLGVMFLKAMGVWPTARKEDPVPLDEGGAVTPMEEDTDSHCPEENAMLDCAFPQLPRIPPGYPVALARIAIGDSFVSKAKGQDDGVPLEKAKAGYPLDPSTLVRVKIPRHTVDSIFAKLGYEFKDHYLLDEALTHCSCENKLNNQRLEFLGDAVLDFAVVTLLYSRQAWAKQGDLSSQKSACTCNKWLAIFAVKLGLQKHLQVMSSQLMNDFSEIPQFSDTSPTARRRFEEVDSNAQRDESLSEAGAVLTEAEREQRYNTDGAIRDVKHNDVSAGKKVKLPKSDNCKSVTAEEFVETCKPSVAKSLADLMEALIGAVYLDSNGSLDAVSNVVLKIGLMSHIKEFDKRSQKKRYVRDSLSAESSQDLL